MKSLLGEKNNKSREREREKKKRMVEEEDVVVKRLKELKTERRQEDV